MNTSTPDYTPEPQRAWLSARQAELRAQINVAQATLSTPLSEGGAEASDFKDQADRSEREELQNAELERDLDELAAVESALVRLDDGSYGTCIDCGQPIDARRLIAVPSALRCMACQARYEASASAR